MNIPARGRAFASLLMLAAAACGPVSAVTPEAEPTPPPQEVMDLLGVGATRACIDIAEEHNFPVLAENGLNPLFICVEDLMGYIERHSWQWPGPGIASNVNAPESHAHAAAFSLLTEFEGMDLVTMRSPEGGVWLEDIMGSLAEQREILDGIRPDLVMH